jgi:hypothetical protein
MKIATDGKAQYNKTAHAKCIDLWKILPDSTNKIMDFCLGGYQQAYLSFMC